MNAMQKYNFIGMLRELEEFFNLFDDDFTGYIPYKDFAHFIFGLGLYGPPRLTVDARRTLRELQQQLVAAGPAGLHEFTASLDTESTHGLTYASDFYGSLKFFGVVLPEEDVMGLLQCFPTYDQETKTVYTTALLAAIKVLSPPAPSLQAWFTHVCSRACPMNGNSL